MVFAQTLTAPRLLGTDARFDIFVQALVLSFLLSFALDDKPFLPIQSFNISYDVFTLLIKLVKSFSVHLAILFKPEILPWHIIYMFILIHKHIWMRIKLKCNKIQIICRSFLTFKA